VVTFTIPPKEIPILVLLQVQPLKISQMIGVVQLAGWKKRILNPTMGEIK
jgi:hypothetical protein